ncbi:LysR family transcriptional regulator [Planomonospora alba]
MELRQLRYFCAVAAEENLTRAAESLGIRATSLSQQIIALERELGTVLFRRTPAGMVPTAAGRALVPHARRTLEEAEQAVQAVRAAPGHGVLRLGVTPGAPPDAVPALLNALRQADLRDLPVVQQLKLVRAGGLDAGLIVLPADATGLRLSVISDVPLGALLAARHRLAARARLTWADLAGQDLLWFQRDLAPGYHDMVLETVRAAGWTPRRLRTGAPRRSLFVNELLYGGDVVALRPQWESAEGLVWRPLDGAPRLRHALVWDRSHQDAQRLSRLAAHLAGEAAP